MGGDGARDQGAGTGPAISGSDRRIDGSPSSYDRQVELAHRTTENSSQALIQKAHVRAGSVLAARWSARGFLHLRTSPVRSNLVNERRPDGRSLTATRPPR